MSPQHVPHTGTGRLLLLSRIVCSSNGSAVYGIKSCRDPPSKLELWLDRVGGSVTIRFAVSRISSRKQGSSASINPFYSGKWAAVTAMSGTLTLREGIRRRPTVYWQLIRGSPDSVHKHPWTGDSADYQPGRHLTPRTHAWGQKNLAYLDRNEFSPRQASPFAVSSEEVPDSLKLYLEHVSTLVTAPFVPVDVSGTHVFDCQTLKNLDLSPFAMQSATCTNLRIRSPADVRVIFHAVLLDILPMVNRRLDSEERSLIVPGSVYVWEERGAQAEIAGVGIERWTDGIRWGPSRVREGFLFYHEKPSSHYIVPGGIYPMHRQPASQELLIKQTYTAFVDTPRGQRKWHLIAYFTEESVDRLTCIDDYPALSTLNVPHGQYKSARSVKGRPDHIFNPDADSSGEFSQQLQYVAYDPIPSSASSCSRSSTRSTPSPHHNPRSLMSPSPRHNPRSLTWNGPSASDRATRSRQPSDGHKRGRSLPETLAPSSRSAAGYESLAPLQYLETVTPPRRHPIDETALKLFKAVP